MLTCPSFPSQYQKHPWRLIYILQGHQPEVQAGPPAASWASYLGSPSRPDPPVGIWAYGG